MALASGMTPLEAQEANKMLWILLRSAEEIASPDSNNNQMS